jgi:hypothetical protein
MKKSGINQSGFGAIGLVLVVVLVGLIAAAGWIAYQRNRPAKSPAAMVSTPTPTPVPSIAGGPYAGWKTATLKYEKISYNYPTNWIVKDDSIDVPKSQNGCAYPGHDVVTLVSPSGTQVAFNAGQDCFGGGNTKAFGSAPIKALGQDLYLVFEGDAPPAPPSTGPNSACLAPTANPETSFSFTSKNIFHKGDGGPPVNSFCFFAYNPSNYAGAPPSLTVAQIENSADYATAKMIFESMHY